MIGFGLANFNTVLDRDMLEELIPRGKIQSVVSLQGGGSL